MCLRSLRVLVRDAVRYVDSPATVCTDGGGSFDGSQRLGRQSSVRFSNAIREQLPGGGGFGHFAETDDTVERFNASFRQVFIGRENKEMDTLVGETRMLEDGRVEIAINVMPRNGFNFPYVGSKMLRSRAMASQSVNWTRKPEYTRS